MGYKVLIRPEAEKDLTDAFTWYEGKRRGLGHDFLLRVDAGLHFIARNPLLSSSGYKETRAHLVKRFPCKIVYLVDDNVLIVLGVLHGRRSSRIVHQRTSDL